MVLKLSLAIFSLIFLQSTVGYEKCRSKPDIKIDFNSNAAYSEFNFQPNWTRGYKHFWKSEDFDFESRFLKYEMSPEDVRVFLIPFSHCDPGWLDTFEGYYQSSVKKILGNSVVKLMEYSNMTFVWSEISFLSKWWDEARFAQKKTFKKLVELGRIEILTGGWVMPDEASSSLYALINQLIEGHQWIQQHLGDIKINSAWTLDPFGVGSTFPYLLKKAGIKGIAVQRLHYGWKHWLAEHQSGDFLWFPSWSSDSEDAIVCHNAHYDLYPTKHSCGPFSTTCMTFNFRRIPDLREEQNRFASPVDEHSLPSMSETLLGQYRRTASLTKHNLVMTTLGGDFSFDYALEWDQQYKNYEQLFQHINSQHYHYRTSLKFGTLSEYFKAVEESNVTLPNFRGDFFPYSDIVFAYAPAYWTGYFGTRPYWKKLSREVEDELFKAEILFTLSYNFLRPCNSSSSEILFNNYDNLVFARRAVALFQHHDGVTGTSPRRTMLDYAKKLTYAWNFARQIQRTSIELLWRKMKPVKFMRAPSVVKKVVLFNSFAWKRSHLVRLAVEEPNVIVKGGNGQIITAQVNPHFKRGHIGPVKSSYELLFRVELPPLSLTTYEIQKCPPGHFISKAIKASMLCISCNGSLTKKNINIKNQLILENSRIKLYLDKDSGLLNRVVDKKVDNINGIVNLTFGRYESGLGSGAYLLSPYTSIVHDIINKDNQRLYLIEGPVSSEVVLITNEMKFTTLLFQNGPPNQMPIIYMSNEFKSKEHEVGDYFMRIQTNLNNTKGNPKAHQYRYVRKSPSFFTDTNGFAIQKRVTIPRLPYQANNFPMTSFAYLQDLKDGLRLSLVADRAHGTSSIETGRLEFIFDRKLNSDDGRGLGDQIMDPETCLTNYAILFESIPKNLNDSEFSGWEPTLNVQKLSKMLNHQLAMFTYDALESEPNLGISFIPDVIPDNIFLLNLRTISKSNVDGIKSVPSNTALMILQNMGHLDTPMRNCISIGNGGGHTDRGSLTVNYNVTSTRRVPSPSSTNLKLKASFILKYSIQETNLVGTRKQSSLSEHSQYVTLGKPYELKSFLVNF